MVPEAERKILIIGDMEIDVTNKTASEVKQLILEKAREKGWRRIEVLVDGVPVSPADFDNAFKNAKKIEVVKKDIAG